MAEGVFYPRKAFFPFISLSRSFVGLLCHPWANSERELLLIDINQRESVTDEAFAEEDVANEIRGEGGTIGANNQDVGHGCLN